MALPPVSGKAYSISRHDAPAALERNQALPQIENEADLRYARAGLRRVVDMPPASLASLEQARRHGMGAAERDCSL